MKIRFQADYNLRGAIVQGLTQRQPAIDFQTGHEAGLVGLDDPSVLAQAAREGRMLVSHDRRTIPYHFADFILNNDSPGVVIVPQDLPIGLAIEELLILWETSEAEEWINTIISIPL
jgi:hypothetical protein